MLGKRIINSNDAGVSTCSSDTTDIFGNSSGIALYSMNYDASDESGSYDGTPTNIEFGVGGQISYGAGFNGSSSRIIPATDPIPSSGAFTVSAWVKTSITNHCFISFGNFWLKSEYSSGVFSLGDINPSFQGTTDISDGYWHHCVVTVDASNNITLYVDGSSEDTGTSTISRTSGGTFAIGVARTSSPVYYWNGSIDQVRIFNSALNQSQVDVLYAETACVYASTTDIVNYPTGTTPTAYYKMDNSSEDYAGSNDGTDTNVEYRFGRFGQAAVFNGSSSQILTPTGTAPSGGNSRSFSLWLNCTNTTSNQTLINYGTINPPSSDFFVWRLNGSSSSTIEFSDFVNTYSESASSAFDGNWHHLSFVYDGSKVQFYLDGSALGSGYNYSLTTANTIMSIGSYTTGAAFLDGSIDQVRIYPTVLSAGQVTELYNEKPETDTSNFKAVLYEGNGTTQYISNVGYNLDVDNGGDGGMVWIKNRSAVQNHYLFDSVRGEFKAIYPDLTNAEFSSTNYISFDASGFPTGSTLNQNGNDYVAWVWKAGGEAVSNTDGSITSTVSANQAAGFSIVSYTGNGSSGATVGHGLSQEPELIIPKNRDAALSWIVGATPIGKSYILDLANPNPKLSRPNQYYYDWNSTTITMGSEAHINGLNNKIIAYCFHSVDGYQKVGSFNQSSGTTTVSTGFEPRFLIMKRTDNTGNWMVFDYVRSNGDAVLYANSNVEEQATVGFTMAFNNDGFVLTIAAGSYNVDYIYLAIA